MADPSFEIDQAARNAALRALVLGAVGVRLAEVAEPLLYVSAIRTLAESVMPSPDLNAYAALAETELEKLLNELERFATQRGAGG